MLNSMNTATALTVIEREYGSVEEFAYRLLSDPELKVALDDAQPMTRRAEIAQLPLGVFARVIASPAFRTILRADLVNQAYGLEAEAQHIQQMSKIARGEKRLVMNAKGNYGEVDQAPTDVIAAGRYLNELRGTPVESKGTALGGGITINIHNANNEQPERVEVTDVSFAVQDAPDIHRPARAGQLPPSGVLGRGSPAAPRAATELGTGSDGGLGAIYGESAEEADEAAELARKRAGGAVEPAEDDDGLEAREAEDGVNRRKASGPWPGRRGGQHLNWDRVMAGRDG